MGTDKNTYALKPLALAFVLLLAAALGCHKLDIHEDVPAEAPAGMVPVELNLASMYTPMRTKAPVDNGGLQGLTPKLLAADNSLRLIVLKNEPGENGLIRKADLLENTKYPGELGFVYILKSDKFGNVYPQPCRVDDDGNYIEGSMTTSPYYLPVAEAGTQASYYCMAISPAKKLEEDTDGYMKVAVNNKEDILVSNNMWHQTKYRELVVSDKVTNKATVDLNPMMYSTALIRIKVINGDHVTALFPGQPFLGFDRVPTDPGKSWTGDEDDRENTASPDDDNTTAGKQHLMPKYNLPIGGQIESQMGNNILYNRLFVNEYEMTENMVDITPVGSVVDKWRKDIVITTETNILPMDARPTPMIIKINIYVNETPMQFQFQTGKNFKPGHVYDYVATIKLNPDNIYIASWQDVSWSWSMEPDEEETE